MKPVTVREICDAVRGTLCGSGAETINGVSANTRELRQGEVFFALVANRDGHQFVPAAFAAGSPVAVVSKAVDIPQGRSLIFVGDTLRALGDLAAWHRRRMPATVIGVTGSNGKTTTKEMLGHILAAAAPTIKSPGSFNNALGVPLTLFRVEEADRYAVIEMGTSSHGEISRLAEIAAPAIGVVTNVSATHLQGLGNPKGVAAEKGCLIEALPADGCAVLNGDDYWCREMAARSRARVVRHGLHEGCEVRATGVEASGTGMRFEALGRAFQLRVMGEHNVSNALAAIAACTELGLRPELIAERLATFHLLPMRMERIEIGSITVYNDAYNANLASMLAALREFSRLRVPGRKIAVCGDMLELGEQSEEIHREVGRRVAGLGFDALIAVGETARHLANGAAGSGMPEERIRYFATTHDACGMLPRLLERCDTLLLKGSRRMELERMVAAVQSWEPTGATATTDAAAALYHTFRAQAHRAPSDSQVAGA